MNVHVASPHYDQCHPSMDKGEIFKLQRKGVSQKVIHWPDINVADVFDEHVASRNHGQCRPSMDMGDNPDNGDIIYDTKRYSAEI